MSIQQNSSAIRNAYREWCRKNNRPEFLRIARSEINEDFWYIFDETSPDYRKRFGFNMGGRGGGRSTNIAKALIHCAIDNKIRIVAGRSFQNSVEDSCKQDLLEQIESLGVMNYFDVKRRDGAIVCMTSESKFIFRGFERADKTIKSLSSVDILWWEEADGALMSMLDKIEPTIRKSRSRLLFSWNQQKEDAPIEKFRITQRKHKLGSVERNTHYFNNPWCPESIIESANLMKETDFEKYLHVYEGHYYHSSERSIFGRLVRKNSFEIDETFGQPLIGIDWGYSVDPTCVVEAYVKGRDIFVRRAAGKVKLALTDTAPWLMKHIPNILSYTNRADRSRPETIDLCRNLIPLMKGANQNPGMKETGIAFIQSFNNIFVHPECQHDFAVELSKYSWKLDKYEEITAIPEDGNDHFADALRYALEPEIRRRESFIVVG